MVLNVGQIDGHYPCSKHLSAGQMQAIVQGTS